MEQTKTPLRTIVIEIHDGNNFDLREGDRTCPGLCWDEMLGTIAELTHPAIGQARYRMRTAEEEQTYREWIAGRAAHPNTPRLALPSPMPREDA